MNIHIWGNASEGRLGLGDNSTGTSRDHRHEPTSLDTCPTEKTNWSQIACGGCHTVALTKEGKVYTWGSNSNGQLGHGDNISRDIPTKVVSLEGLIVIKVSCGSSHTAVVTDKGEIFTWGYGRYGKLALGHNTIEDELAPRKVEALDGEVIVGVTCGGYHTCIFTLTGSIYTLGETMIVIGLYIEPGHVLPRLLGDLSSKGVICVSAYDSFTACITKAGEVFTWGGGSHGRLVLGDETNQMTPKLFESLVCVRATQVACGDYLTAVCTEDGKVFTFGRGDNGELGSPGLVQALENYHVTQVQCGVGHSMALTSSGYVFTWGTNYYFYITENGGGCLGHGKSKLKYFSIPRLVEGLREHNVVQITTYRRHSAVLVDPSPSGIRQSQLASFNNKEDSDVVIMVENEPLYGNVDVLSQKSDYFAAMFRSNMRESLERVVKVPNCSKAAFLKVLEYLCVDGFTVSLEDVLEQWELADMYQLEGLKYCCMSALEMGLCEGNVSQILEDIEDLQCECDELKAFVRRTCKEKKRNYKLTN